jgi:D-beta-D-heptose 7-phosphate kinase/D-beta-D-heptose 1-phosphate adenosyltransferase
LISNSVKSIKGNSRPIDNEAVRISKLSNQNEVDAIIVFSEETPIKLIEAINPNILFKGSDYQEKDVIGRDIVKKNGGKIELIDILNGYSTTGLINKNT